MQCISILPCQFMLIYSTIYNYDDMVINQGSSKIFKSSAHEVQDWKADYI